MNFNDRKEYEKPLSESFIEENAGRVKWLWISSYQKLSESFIEKHEGWVSWGSISINQKLSESFIEKYADRVNWDYISIYQKLSEEFRIKHNLTISEHSWLYTDTQSKRKAIEDCGLYEFDGDCVLAYKGIRSDNYSKFNFQYKYEVGGTHLVCLLGLKKKQKIIVIKN